MAKSFQSIANKVRLANRLEEKSVVTNETGVKVTVRVRPFIREEILGDRGKPVLCVAMPTKDTVDLLDEKGRPTTFTFDRAYWSHDKSHEYFASQATLYDELGTTLLEHAIGGYNNCIFAYGQTGSGKSHSVLGQDSEEGRGLLPRVVQGLFEHLSSIPDGSSSRCLVSFMEIYNEQIFDLLGTADSLKKDLRIRLHPVLGTVVIGLTECEVVCKEEVMRLIDYGVNQRTTGSTSMNNTSSRSHCIFTFKTTITDAGGSVRMSRTHLVDLAGSERAGRTQAEGNRLKEGAAINQSLSTLARVINALASAKGNKKDKLPPFRDSKLTYILKESLCGNSKTVMMAAISPSLADYDETLSTLKFAQSVKKVQTCAMVNEINEGSEREMVEQLRKECLTLREQLVTVKWQRAVDIARFEGKLKQLREGELLLQSLGDADVRRPSQSSEPTSSTSTQEPRRLSFGIVSPLQLPSESVSSQEQKDCAILQSLLNSVDESDSEDSEWAQQGPSEDQQGATRADLGSQGLDEELELARSREAAAEARAQRAEAEVKELRERLEEALASEQQRPPPPFWDRLWLNSLCCASRLRPTSQNFTDSIPRHIEIR